MNPFLRYLADKNSAHRHTPMITRPCGLRRAGNKIIVNLKGSCYCLFLSLAVRLTLRYTLLFIYLHLFVLVILSK